MSVLIRPRAPAAPTSEPRLHSMPFSLGHYAGLMAVSNTRTRLVGRGLVQSKLNDDEHRLGRKASRNENRQRPTKFSGGPVIANPNTWITFEQSGRTGQAFGSWVEYPDLAYRFKSWRRMARSV
ncbi:hypothetical protein AC579_3240 [Pseudocercospora musae]|uniref:Uncharacterized protein n=1 Tax=Pseudocercospora musae TaxID=113226 RepID=A0A139GT45_9PEZI|nr:hypothetical protein AC579_3240 [Pseudocercospora musae]